MRETRPRKTDAISKPRWRRRTKYRLFGLLLLTVFFGGGLTHALWDKYVFGNARIHFYVHVSTPTGAPAAGMKVQVRIVRHNLTSLLPIMWSSAGTDTLKSSAVCDENGNFSIVGWGTKFYFWLDPSGKEWQPTTTPLTFSPIASQQVPMVETDREHPCRIVITGYNGNGDPLIARRK